MGRKLAVAALAALHTACIRSLHPNGPSGPPVPGGEARLLEERPGYGRRVIPGDRIVVDFVGQYGSGEVWGEGPLTLIVGKGTYPGVRDPLQVGAVIKMQYPVDPNDTTVRLVPFPGGDTENEAFQVRHDRGQILVEHKIRRVCRPLKLHVISNGFIEIHPEIGCWPIPRALPRSLGADQQALEPQQREPNGAAGAEPDGHLIDPPVVARAPADTSRYLGENGLHRAAADGRPEIVGWLLRKGRNVSAVDSFGFLPIHYVGWAQKPIERFVPAFEQSYLDVVDTLLAHAATIDAAVTRGRLAEPAIQTATSLGQTALGFAAAECADRLVNRLLARGASADAGAVSRASAIAQAAMNGCPETVAMLIEKGANVELDPAGGGTPLERLISVSAFHQGHLACARLLVRAGAKRKVAAERLADRLRDPGQGSFGFSNRPMARQILALLRS